MPALSPGEIADRQTDGRVRSEKWHLDFLNYWRNRKRVRPPGSAVKVTIAERSSIQSSL